jgi:phenylalanyl-tRNA synthetase alpha chain
LLIEPLSKGEQQILSILVKERRELPIEKIAEITQLPQSSVSSFIELLKNRGIINIIEYEVSRAKTTDEGKLYISKLPEEILINILLEKGGLADIAEIENAMGKEIANIALGWAKRRGWVEVIKEGTKTLVRFVSYESLNEHRSLLAKYLNEDEVPKDLENNEVFKELVRRKLITVYRKKIKFVKLAIPIEKAEEILRLGEGISRLTREVIVKDLWKTSIIKPYNLSALPPTRYGGKKHFFKEFVKMIKEVMESLGFEEVGDDYIIPELWNFDILFQAQDHPSRDIHDILLVEGSANIDMFRDVVERVKNVHEYGGSSGSIGWRYQWSYSKASRLILRSHTTAVTARALIGRNPPARLYVIARVFRRDNPDARHSPEFTNFDGVIMEKDFTFRKLLGLLTQILRYLGIEKLKFKPSYFPFTEPSVEGYGYVPGYGWIEIFGAGMFRPEVLEILGVKYPVGAWGMGVERIAMITYGINDIRLIFANDVDYMRKFPTIKVLVSGVRCP